MLSFAFSTKTSNGQLKNWKLPFFLPVFFLPQCLCCSERPSTLLMNTSGFSSGILMPSYNIKPLETKSNAELNNIQNVQKLKQKGFLKTLQPAWPPRQVTPSAFLFAQTILAHLYVSCALVLDDLRLCMLLERQQSSEVGRGTRVLVPSPFFLSQHVTLAEVGSLYNFYSCPGTPSSVMCLLVASITTRSPCSYLIPQT